MDNLCKIAQKLSSHIKILLVNASPRAQNSCPKEWSKSWKLAQLLMDCPLPVEWDFLDLSVKPPPESKIQPCRGCISTAAPQCHWPCSCYQPNSPTEPDLLHNLNVYDRLEQCNGILIIAPIHWYSQPTQLKAMFDRLVCANGGNPYPELTEGKNKNLSRRLELLPEWKIISRNHLAGRTAAFLIHGDDGANELGPDGYPKFMRPEDKDYDLNEELEWSNPIHSVMNLIMQCRYSGIHVNPRHVIGLVFGEGLPYGINNLLFAKRAGVMQRVEELATDFIRYTTERQQKVSRVIPQEEREKDKQQLDLSALKEKIMQTDYPTGP